MVKSQDMFGENFYQTVEGDSQVVHSYMGSFCTFIVFIVSLCYAGFKMNILIHNKEINVLYTIHEHAFDHDY